MSNMLEILSKNKYFFIFKINFINKKTTKKTLQMNQISSKIKYTKNKFCFF